MSVRQTTNNFCEVEGCKIPAIAENRCILHYLDHKKDKEAFKIAIQNKLSRNDFNFQQVCFIDKFSFAGKTLESADFNNSIFDEVDFSETKFVGETNFSNTHFSHSAKFSSSSFLGNTDFSNSRFYNKIEADFRETKFYGIVDFTGTMFTGTCNFFRAKFCGKANFVETRFNLIDFRFVEIVGADKVIFQDLSMRTKLAGTDLRHIEFFNLEWPIRLGRKVVYDELSPHDFGILYQSDDFYDEIWMKKAKIYPYIERLYRFLKLNYEGEGDLKSSGDFHYGEMEMHRKARIWRWFPLYWYNIYEYQAVMENDHSGRYSAFRF